MYIHMYIQYIYIYIHIHVYIYMYISPKLALNTSSKRLIPAITIEAMIMTHIYVHKYVIIYIPTHEMRVYVYIT
jgi:hypothetical protein